MFVTRVPKKIQRKELNEFDENQLYFHRSLFSGSVNETINELDSLFGELKSGIIVTDDTFKVVYTNSVFHSLGIFYSESSTSRPKITEILPSLIEKEHLVGFYEHLMMRKPFVLEEGFTLSRIERINLTPVAGGRFLLKININEYYTESAANLLRYFPELPFAFCGIRLESSKKIKIEFCSDNFPRVFSVNGNVNELESFNHLISVDDLPVFLKNTTAVRKGKMGAFVQEIRLLNFQQKDTKWFRLYLSRYRDSGSDPFCLVYLQDINDEKLREVEQESLVNDIIDSERERMAMELHDGLGQQMVAAKLHLDILKSKFGNAVEFELCSTILRDSILQMKALCYNLAPPDFEKGLVLSLERLFGRLNEFSKDIEYRFTPKRIPIRELGTQETYNILRIIQEFVSNSQKYSGCSLINCEIGRKNDKIAILLNDNGIGFELNSVKRGFGLSNIEKRAKLANAKVEFNSSPNEGTYLYLEI